MKEASKLEKALYQTRNGVVGWPVLQTSSPLDDNWDLVLTNTPFQERLWEVKSAYEVDYPPGHLHCIFKVIPAWTPTSCRQKPRDLLRILGIIVRFELHHMTERQATGFTV